MTKIFCWYKFNIAQTNYLLQHKVNIPVKTGISAFYTIKISQNVMKVK